MQIHISSFESKLLHYQINVRIVINADVTRARPPPPRTYIKRGNKVRRGKGEKRVLRGEERKEWQVWMRGRKEGKMWEEG